MNFNEILANPEILLQNQFLVGGVGTVLLTGAAYFVRSIPFKIIGLFQGTTSTFLTVNTRYKEYDQVASTMNRYAFQAMRRSFAPARNNNDYASMYSRRKSGQGAPTNLAPGYGGGWGRYNGTFFRYSRGLIEKANNIEETMDLRFMTRDVRVVSRFLEEACNIDYEGFVKLHLQEFDYFGPAKRKVKRDIDTVFIDQATKDRVVGRIDWFIQNEEWYARRGIPYKLCMMLHGQPGTGKTSLVHAIASKFNLSINYVTSLEKLGTVIVDCHEGDLVVIEDIDTLMPDMNRGGDKTKVEEKDSDEPFKEVKRHSDGMTLHRVLNAIDGFCTPHGVKIVMTTNHPEKLDPALLRAGRTDLMVEIKHLEAPEIRAMYRAFYGDEAVARLPDLTGIAPHKGADLQEMFTTHSAESARAALCGRPREMAA